MSDFLRLIEQLNYGGVADDLDAKYKQMTEAVRQHKKAGVIVMTIKVEPVNADQVKVTDTVKMSLPEADRPSTIMYFRSKEDSRLSARDPRQPNLPDSFAVADAVAKSLTEETASNA